MRTMRKQFPVTWLTSWLTSYYGSWSKLLTNTMSGPPVVQVDKNAKQNGAILSAILTEQA